MTWLDFGWFKDQYLSVTINFLENFQKIVKSNLIAAHCCGIVLDNNMRIITIPPQK